MEYLLLLWIHFYSDMHKYSLARSYQSYKTVYFISLSHAVILEVSMFPLHLLINFILKS